MIDQLNSEKEALRRATLECKKFLMDKWKNEKGNGLTPDVGEEVLSYLKFIVFDDQNIDDHKAIEVLRSRHVGTTDNSEFNKYWSVKIE